MRSLRLTPAQRERVANSLHLADRIAKRILARMPPSVEIEDLMQAGRIGLIDAARSYDPTQGVPWAAYASKKARWAILSSIRRGEWWNLTMASLADPPSGDDDAAVIENRGQSVEDDTEARLLAEQMAGEIWRFVEVLPPAHGLVVQAMYLDGQTSAQTAKRLHISRSRVEALHVEALTILRARPDLARLVA